MLLFDQSIYEDCVSGFAYKAYCNKSYKPSSYDLSFDSVIEDGDVWFVKRDFLQEFFSVLPVGCPSISIVTQHSDYEVDDRVMECKPRCVRKIFGANTTTIHADAVPIPLGLGPPYCGLTPKSQDIKKLNTTRERLGLLYVNFRTETYPRERQVVMELMSGLGLKCKGITIQSVSSHFDQYLEQITHHKFCACPRGNGVDTHRLWECLYCRTIPVVRREPAHRNFADLPIAFVDSWDEVTEDFLNSEYERICSQEWNYSKLRASWWGNKFKEIS